MLAKRVGIRAAHKPMIAYRRHPGESHGHHWFDCLVGCAAAASMEGANAPGHEAQERAQPKRKRYTQADLERARRAR